MDNYTSKQRRFINVQRGKVISGVYSVRDFGPDNHSSLQGRDPVTEFTASSRKRFKRFLINAVARYKVFITLTYPPGPGMGTDGYTCKRDIDAFFKAYIRARPEKGLSIIWWQEWQANGRVHIHALATHPLHYQRVAELWFRIVGSNNLQHLSAGTEIRKIKGKRAQIASYAVKYAVKTEQKEVPEPYRHPGRFWGVRGIRRTVEATTTFTAFQSEQPEAAERHNELVMYRRKLIQEGKMTYFLLKTEEYSLVLYLWSIDDESIRLGIMRLVNQFAESIE